MALVGWFLSFICLFGALALRQDMPIGGSATIASMLFALALLSCPMIWRDQPLGISRKQRIMFGLTLAFALPLLILPAA